AAAGDEHRGRARGWHRRPACARTQVTGGTPVPPGARRMKSGPIIAMLLILGLSMWIMVATSPSAAPTPGAVQFDVVVSSHKAKVELIPAGVNQTTESHYRFLNWPDVG